MHFRRFSLRRAPDNRDVMVDFPSIDGAKPAVLVPDAQLAPSAYLPFRRISFPSTPNLQLQRQSIASLASFDSIPEGPQPPATAIPLFRPPSKGAKRRGSSVDPAKRPHRRKEVKSVMVDEQREAKRRKVINELYETERTYVDGLELIYSHFLTPIIASLDTPNQLLDRAELTSVFANFIDIWNLHRSFYSSLSSALNASTSTVQEQAPPPPISPILLSHFPYLSLYTPFVSSFADALTSCNTLLSKHAHFAAFMATQEADPRCGKLKFRDWLLTIVQRCPRYLLLLKDLINCTDQEDPEHANLAAAHTLVSKITDSLNASLHTHTQTLALLAIQRSTVGLPFQLITPGRTFIRRGPLLQVGGSTPREREFLLFSDCLVWLSSADKTEDPERKQHWEQLVNEPPLSPDRRPNLSRSRSKSDADLPTQAGLRRNGSAGFRLKLSGPSLKKRMSSAGVTEEKWVYKGHIELVDLEVVLGPPGEPNEHLRVEVLSPRKSFALYACSEEERDEWASAIRTAKASLLISLNVMHPNSTLTSSASTHHLRHALQALPYSPEEESKNPKRGRVEHFVPAIWIPDSKTESCMRCGRTFGWRRRRHHCRLCGRCVCHTCSTKTFFIVDSSGARMKPGHKSARACDACYDTVFPVMTPGPEPAGATATISHLTLSGLRSMPSLLLEDSIHTSPSVLMAIDVEPMMRRQRSRDVHLAPVPSREPSDGPVRMPAVRIKAPSRPRSFIEIVHDLNDVPDDAPSPAGTSPATSRFSHGGPEASTVLDDLEEDEDEDDAEASEMHAHSMSSPEEPATSTSLPPTPVHASIVALRKEDTVRRRKRFSLPAVAIHTTPVTTKSNVVGEGKSKRWSLVLGNLKTNGSEFVQGVAAGKLSELLGRQAKTATPA
ncbi:FYVE, RhoGEF and PH domain-containing protein [Phanerochaete sordida]|uniref:FYVE, RhoGEF and PH domain-containing protein n=1 Tax=Phanerochaete sordida TaxID=48140 RepID=A0A9P3G5M3_9APHY|nr:FYVE, RhoGEF and PH domain-containing protein [Phanerochaete sordida]